MVAKPSCLALSTIAWKAGSTLVAVVAAVEAVDACGFDLPELPQAPATMAMASTIVTDANVNLDGRDIAIRLPLVGAPLVPVPPFVMTGDCLPCGPARNSCLMYFS